ncbi:MAG: cobalt ECF transporter T component CbiQ [Spirochaetota bacterium]|nr:MAG: cobalt ECF transporter T component CbiQ [Spirochaetota bacterium]
MIIENFAEGKSLLHTTDPRIKICLCVPYIFVIALSNSLYTAAAAVLIALSLIIISGLRLGNVLKSIRVFFWFILLLWVVLPFSIPGDQIIRLGPLRASSQGVLKALAISLKSTAIVFFIIAFLGTTKVFSLVHAMSHFHMPKKLLYLTFLSYRYIHVIYMEYVKLRDAMRIRGFRPKTNIHTYKSIGYLIGMLLIRSYERSERIYNAMLCRGFHGRFYLFEHFAVTGRDMVFLSIMAATLMGIGWMEWITKIM